MSVTVAMLESKNADNVHQQPKHGHLQQAVCVDRGRVEKPLQIMTRRMPDKKHCTGDIIEGNKGIEIEDKHK